MTAVGELTNWTVAWIGGGTGEECKVSDILRVNMLKRTSDGSTEKYSIGRLLSPRDEMIDLNEPAYNAALALTREARRSDPGRLKDRDKIPDTPSGPAVRKVRGFGAAAVPARPDKGLLLLYALDPLKAEANFPAGTPPVIGFGISFPGSNSGLKVEYKANNVLWEQEYGQAD